MDVCVDEPGNDDRAAVVVHHIFGEHGGQITPGSSPLDGAVTAYYEGAVG
jgi:hypothetical protein